MRTINGRTHIYFNSRDENKEVDTTVTDKAQEAYKKKCEELGLEYKPLADAPKVYRGIKDVKDT